MEKLREICSKTFSPQDMEMLEKPANKMAEIIAEASAITVNINGLCFL